MHATIEVIEKKKKQSSTFPIHAYREAMRASRGAFNDGKGAYRQIDRRNSSKIRSIGTPVLVTESGGAVVYS
jgi:hypothetical protein